MEALTAQQYEIVNNAAQLFLTILQYTIDVEVRPRQIPMPRACGSIILFKFMLQILGLDMEGQRKKEKFSEEKIHV